MKNLITKTAIIIVSLFFITQSLQAQVWDSLNMGPGVGGGSGSTTLISNYNNDIYAGGSIVYYIVIKKWTGSTWTDINAGFQGITFLSAFAEYKNELYMTGYFDSVSGLGGLHKIARWNGNNISKVGIGFNKFSEPGSMIVYDSMLYVGGTFDSAGGVPAKNLARWNGTQWSSVGGATGPSYTVTSLGIYNGSMVVSGSFDSIGGVAAKNIALWNGTAWSALGNGIAGFATTILGDGTKLYIGGYNLDSAGGIAVNHLAVWNGSGWAAWGAGTKGYITAFTAYNGNIYIGGQFDSLGGVPANNIAQFNGTSWYGVGGGLDSAMPNPFGSFITSMAVNDGSLYVAGNFEHAGNVYGADGVLRWGAPRVQGINTVGDNNQVNVYPNPGNGILNIAINDITEQCQVEVYNLLGEKIYHSHLNKGNTTIDIGRQSVGAYLYRVLKEDGALVSSGKYVLE